MTQSTAPALLLSTGLDRRLAWRRGGSVRHLVSTLSARAGAAAAPVEAALNLALAVDVSGSMSGRKLAAAKAAAREMILRLRDRDTLAVVTFGDRAALALEPTPMDAAGRELALRRVEAIAIDGNTNLFEGWTTAASAVAGVMARHAGRTGRSNRVVVLSDGQANVGVTSRDEIARHVRALLDRDVVTSAIGVGDDYDEAMLGAIAQAGGGNLHDAARGAEVGEVVMGELSAGRAALLERVTLDVDAPPGATVEVVGTWAVATTAAPGGGTRLSVTVGALLPGQSKVVVTRVRCPDGVAGATLPLSASAHGLAADGSGSVSASPSVATLTLAPGAENSAQPRDLALVAAAGSAWVAELVDRAVASNRDGAGAEARAGIDRALPSLERLVAGVPEGPALLDALRVVRDRVGERWDQRTRKEVYVSNHKSSRGELDYTSTAPASAADRLRNG